MIKCQNCGEKVDEGAFCMKCGADLSKSAKQTKKSRKMKFPYFLVGTVLGAALGLGGFFAVSTMRPDAVLGKTAKNSKIEGNGFDTPEEAMIAYLSAMRNGDVEGMISAFAVETYVEHYDFKQYLQDMGSYSLASAPALPVSDKYTEELMIQQRKGDLYNFFAYQYFELTDPTDLKGNSLLKDLNGQPVSGFKEDSNKIEAFVDGLSNKNWTKNLSELTYGQVMRLSDMKDIFQEKANSKQMDENIEAYEKRYGADQIIPLAVEAEFQGKSYYVTANAVCYEGKWYLLDPNGITGILLGSTRGFFER